MLLGRLRIRGKLALLVTIPLLAVVVLTVPVVLDRVNQATRAAGTARSVRVAGQVGSLVRDLQQERLLSVGYLFRVVDPARLQEQASLVTRHVADLKANLGASGVVSVAIDAVTGLSDLRSGVLSGAVAPDKIIAGYVAVINGLINSLRLEDGVDVATKDGRQVVALDAALRTDEGITVGAADLLLAVGAKDPRALMPYVANLSALQVQADRLTTYATADQVALYTKVRNEVDARLGKNFVITPGADPTESIARLSPQTALTALEGLIGFGKGVEQKIIDDVTAEVTSQQNRALATAYVVGGVALLILLVVVLLVLAVGRAVAWPLTRLTGSADRVARVAESELVRVADDEAESPAPVHLDSVDVRARDEIGDLARAFERVQGTAARLVERQVASRRNVAQMFGHVGRRTQNLVGRQIALIDRLEREETDPARLQHLYRLDHVSSRLARNAGSLVVLSGSTGSNEHVHPLPLADVVRLALGEIEDYVRVDVEMPQGLALVPNLINDVVLMLAELMENATVFSPPHTRVTVAAQVTPYGAQLGVIDRGIGLSEERLAEENARLARRERLDLAPTEVLGLFVVGRLARRHGLGVALWPTPGGGLTATIALPARLLTKVAVPLAPERPAVTAQPAPLPYDVAAVQRASRTIEAGGRWNAFIPQQRRGFLSGGLSTPAHPPLRQGVPGAHLPAAPPAPAPAPTPVAADAALAQALVDDFEAGVRRAQRQAFEVPAPPVAAPTGPTPATSPLTRRVPGATLDAVTGPAPVAAPVLTQQQSLDPDEARALVEQFETGVLQALREVRSDHQYSEGSR